MTNQDPSNNQDQRQDRMDFNQFMFGRAPAEHQNPDSEEEENSFDIFETTSTLFETYRQLSPYFEQITHLIKKIK